MSCAICHTRRPRRACPGIHADICAVCCGAAREVTVSCPYHCEYLREARKHEPAAEFDDSVLGNPNIPVTEEFLDGHAGLLLAANIALVEAAGENGALDSDVREALASLIQTYRVLGSGVIYEGLPTNPIAAHVHRGFQNGLAEFRRQETRELGMTKTRDKDVLSVLVFFERLTLLHNNGRPRCRAFLDLLRSLQPEAPPDLDIAPSSLILP